MTVIKRGNKTISITYQNNSILLNGTGIVKYENMSIEGSRFEYSTTIFNNITGLRFLENEITEINNTRIAIEEKIRNFFNRDDLIIKCLNNSHYYIEESKEFENLSQEIFYTLKEEFIEKNKRFFLESSRIKKNYEDDIVFYSIQKKRNVIDVELVRKYKTGEELKENETIEKIEEEINDIDYGIMSKLIDYVVIKREKEIKN